MRCLRVVLVIVPLNISARHNAAICRVQQNDVLDVLALVPLAGWDKGTLQNKGVMVLD